MILHAFYRKSTNKVSVFEENNKRVRYLEKHEIKKILEVCTEHLRPILITALNTGMRKGEILNLRWDDIDLNRGIIYIRSAKGKGRQQVLINQIHLKDRDCYPIKPMRL